MVPVIQARQAAFFGKIGIARADITPPVGIYARNWGASVHDTYGAFDQPLTLTAFTFQSESESDSEPLVLVSLDLGWWRSRADEEFVRSYVLDQLKLDSARLMISLTHTHAGPVLCRTDCDKPGGNLIIGYLVDLRMAVVKAVRLALEAAFERTLHWEYGVCSLAQNRDFPDPEGKRILCGYNPSGTADNALLAGVIRELAGDTVGTIVNYACHPTTLGPQNRVLSPDYVGYARAVIEESLQGAPCLFLQGASGELAPALQYSHKIADARANGKSLGFSALATISTMIATPGTLEYRGVEESGASLAVWERVEREPPRNLCADEIDVEFDLKPLQTAEEIRAELQSCTDRVAAERLRRRLRIREGIGDGDTASMPAWIWRIGEAILVGHPNEAYSNLQTDLRRRHKGLAIAVMNVVNGHYGYLPPRELYAEDIYPVWQTPFAAGSLERLIAACDGRILDL